MKLSVLLLLAVAVTGCTEPSGPAVRLTVKGLKDGHKTLHPRLWLDGKPSVRVPSLKVAELDRGGPFAGADAVGLGVKLPRGTRGELRIELYAGDEAALATARGAAPLTLTQDGPYDLTIELRPEQACNGNGWCWEHPLPFGGTFQDVWAGGPDDVWIGGEMGQILHWDGELFSWAPLPKKFGFGMRLHGRTGADGAVDLWADSSAGRFHREGNDWREVAPRGRWDNTSLVLATGPGEAWFKGAPGTIVHYKDTRTEILPLPTPPLSPVDVRALWAASSSELWAAGIVGNGENNVGVLLRWREGMGWQELARQPDLKGFAWSRIVGFSTDDLWISSESGGDNYGVVWHWDGTTISRQDPVPQYPAPGSVHYGHSGKNLELFTIQGLRQLARFDGVHPSQPDVAWGALNSAKDIELFLRLYESGPGEVWAVGTPGMVRHLAADQATEVFPRQPGPRTPLRGVWGSGAADVWAVGDGGTVLRSTGAGFARVPEEGWTSKDALRGIWGFGPEDFWIVGSGGITLRRQAGTWRVEKIPDGKELFAVWGPASGEAWAVGDGIYHYSGGSWRPATGVPVISGVSYRSIWGTDAQNLWVGGEAIAQTGAPRKAVLLRYRDGIFTDVSTESTANANARSTITSIWGPPSSWGSARGPVYFAGYGPGSLLTWDGTSWGSVVSSGIQDAMTVGGYRWRKSARVLAGASIGKIADLSAQVGGEAGGHSVTGIWGTDGDPNGDIDGVVYIVNDWGGILSCRQAVCTGQDPPQER